MCVVSWPFVNSWHSVIHARGGELNDSPARGEWHRATFGNWYETGGLEEKKGSKKSVTAVE